MNSKVITHVGEETLKRVREDNLAVILSHDKYVIVERLRTTVKSAC